MSAFIYLLLYYHIYFFYYSHIKSVFNRRLLFAFPFMQIKSMRHCFEIFPLPIFPLHEISDSYCWDVFVKCWFILSILQVLFISILIFNFIFRCNEVSTSSNFILWCKITFICTCCLQYLRLHTVSSFQWYTFTMLYFKSFLSFFYFLSVSSCVSKFWWLSEMRIFIYYGHHDAGVYVYVCLYACVRVCVCVYECVCVWIPS